MKFSSSAGGEGLTPAQLQKKLDDLEQKHSLYKAKEMARGKGLSTSGTKRDILTRLFVHHAEHWTPEGVSRVVRVPQTEKYSWQHLIEHPYGMAMWDVAMINGVEQVVYMAREPRKDVEALPDRVDVHWKATSMGMEIGETRVLPVVVMCYFIPLQTIYEVWFNFYGDNWLFRQHAIELLGKQEKLLILFLDQGPKPVRTIGFFNDMAYFFRGHYKMLKEMPAWTDHDFDEAKRRLMERYTADDIWRMK